MLSDLPIVASFLRQKLAPEIARNVVTAGSVVVALYAISIRFSFNTDIAYLKFGCLAVRASTNLSHLMSFISCFGT
jgi:hypothetical protein